MMRFKVTKIETISVTYEVEAKDADSAKVYVEGLDEIGLNGLRRVYDDYYAEYEVVEADK